MDLDKLGKQKSYQDYIHLLKLLSLPFPIIPTDLDKLGKLKSYQDDIHLPGLSSLPILVTVMLNLAPNNHLGKLNDMGSFRYVPTLDQ